MSMMPEDRSRRWQSLFRRYGIPEETEPDMERGGERTKEAKRESLPRAGDILLPPIGKKKRK